jgi:PKD repeat protein
VVFDNGTTNSSTFSINIAEELNASFTRTETISRTEDMNDISVSVAFEVTAVGDPDSYSWSFPGGTPETSTEANPTVVWVGGGTPEVSLTITRSADGASLEVAESVQVGPENLFTNDYWGFEGEDVVSSLQTWNGAINEPWAPGVLAAINNGYDGKAIEINFPGNDIYYGVISRDYWDSNTQLALGDIVLLSYYAKAGTAGASMQFSRIVNHLPEWSIENPADAQNFQSWNGTEPVELGTDWTRITKIDTLDDLSYPNANNVFPEFGFIGEAAVFSLDKVELKLLGNIN